MQSSVSGEQNIDMYGDQSSISVPASSYELVMAITVQIPILVQVLVSIKILMGCNSHQMMHKLCSACGTSFKSYISKESILL